MSFVASATSLSVADAMGRHYSNYAEANRAFWRQTVLPLVSRTANALARWLGPAWGSEITLRADLDQIEARSPERRRNHSALPSKLYRRGQTRRG